MEKLEITDKQRLMAIGMMSMIEKHYTEMRKYEKLLVKWFEPWDGEYHITDEIYGNETFDFEAAFEKMGGKIVDDK